jgi:hypothetical protein
MKDNDVLEKLAEIAVGNSKILEALTEEKAKQEGWVFKAPQATTTTAATLHGSGGIWQGPGLERDVITAHVRPYGIASQLPMLPSVDEDPRFASLTGYTATTGTQPTDVCDPAPTAFVKGCNLTARFGQLRYDTNTIEINKVMRRVNRGDFTDLVLRGQVLGMTNLPPEGLNQAQVLDVLTMSEMVTVGVSFERELTRQIWQGSYAIANEFPGLDVQIATGIVDVNTNAACTALDSDVKNFNYTTIDNTIVEYMSAMEWYLYHNAETMGLNPVKWVFAMHPQLWFELTAIWPCAYNTNRCADNTRGDNARTIIDGRENVSERDAMRNGMYIDVNGRRYPVVTDMGIFEHNSTNNANCDLGEYASTIYMIPLTIVGGFPVTYRQYVDYKQGAVDTALLKNLEEFFWTDNGSYLWAVEQTRYCYDISGLTEQRVVLRTPHLAGRIDAVKYSPLQHLRDYHPDSPYFKDGGISVRNAITDPYAVWN